jgi:chemotaxis protein methyltransferase CheR
VPDAECVEFLQWALPRLRLRWTGFRKVRRQVCRRLALRIRELGLEDVRAYRAYLEAHPDEWAELDARCRVTISRFYRDRGVFEFLERTVLPELAAHAATGAGTVEAWSAGCGSGEEPYTLVLAWEHAIRPTFPSVAFHVQGTDVDSAMVERARAATYGASSLHELPEPWRRAFVHRGDRYYLRPRFRRLVSVERADVRDSEPAGPYDLVLCRNLAFTYFDDSLQREVARQLAQALRPGGALVIGSHETLPEGTDLFSAWCSRLGVFRRSPRADGATRPRSGRL